MNTNIVIIVASFIAGYFIISTLLNYSSKVYKQTSDENKDDHKDISSIGEVLSAPIEEKEKKSYR